MTPGGSTLRASGPWILGAIFFYTLNLVNTLLCIWYNKPDICSPFKDQGSCSHLFPGLLNFKEGPALTNKYSKAYMGQRQGQEHPSNRARNNTEGLDEEQKIMRMFRQKDVNPFMRKLMYALILKKYRAKQEEAKNVAARRILQRTALTNCTGMQ